jgi:DNA primase
LARRARATAIRDGGNDTVVVVIEAERRTTWEDVVTMARLFYTALEHLGLVGLPKITGGRGIHISIPIAPHYTFGETRAWDETLSHAIGATVPDLVSWEWSKRARGGRARLDYTQNAINRTLVAPYSVRSSSNASVATPIRWDELDDPDLRPGRWTIESLPLRLMDAANPSHGMLEGVGDHDEHVIARKDVANPAELRQRHSRVRGHDPKQPNRTRFGKPEDLHRVRRR